jgi:hypothetical protein
MAARRQLLLALLALGTTAGGALARGLPEVDYLAPLPPVAAEFTTESDEHDDHPAVRSTWRLWRAPDSVRREYPGNGTAELWQRDGRTVFHTKYFHAERRGIEFQQEDLAMVHALPQWQQLALMVSPDLLKELPQTDAGERDGYSWRRYQGDHNGVTWDITMRLDLMLPTAVLRTAGNEREQLTLVQAWPLTAAPWQPVSTADYRVLDFADLGDNERDPFVMRVQSQLGLAHDHAH